MNRSTCSICNASLRNPKYSFHYIGNVCSICWRMSKKDYVKTVNGFAEKNINIINEIIAMYKPKKILPDINGQGRTEKTEI